MTHEIYLIALVVIPALIIYIFGVNAVYLFFSLLIGYLLTNLLPGNVNRLVNLFSSSNFVHVSQTYDSKLVILYLPVVLTFIFMIKSVHGIHKLINLISSVCFIVLAIFLTLPLIKTNQVSFLLNNNLFHQLIINKSVIIIIDCLVILILLLLERFKKTNSKKHHH
jgi:hypothetical protein